MSMILAPSRWQRVTNRITILIHRFLPLAMALQLQIRSLNGKTLSSPGLFGAGVAVFVCHFHVT